jgi:DNA-binding transcriptional ArsR family regulator
MVVAHVGHDVCEVYAVNDAAVRGVRKRMKPEATYAALAQTFALLGDPTRTRLLDALSHRELCVCDLANLLGMSLSAISHQLRLLRTARVVKARRDGRMMYYSLDDHHIVRLLAEGFRHVEE